MTPHPPKPRLTLRVGITGHRPNKLDAGAVPRLRQQLADVFAMIEQAAANIRKGSEAFYSDDPPAFRLISGLAEGADQMAVAACPECWQIEAVLPFPQEEYLSDFKTSAADGHDARPEFLDSLKKASAVTELPRPPASWRDQGYVHAGSYILRQIDVLVAIWDGLPPKPGGTGAIAREAHVGGIPVVWIAARDTREPRLIVGFGLDGTPQADAGDCTQETLCPVLLEIVGPPEIDKADAREGASPAGLKRYLGERWRRYCMFPAYDALRRVALGTLPRLLISYPSFDQRTHDWDEFMKCAPDANSLHARINSVLLPRYVWADTLAVHFSHLYRSTYVFAYFLSAFAVFIALLTVFIHDDAFTRTILATKAIFVICELFVIGLIIAAVGLGRRLAWHERWLTYRMLAEMLRHCRFLAFLSEFGSSQKDDAKRDRLWMLWYIRATMREIGLPTATLDAEYQKRILNATLLDEIVGPLGQLGYHQHTHDAQHRIDQFLHQLGFICFVGTAIILVIYLALFALLQASDIMALQEFLLLAKPFVTFLSAGLPALGAAVAGIRVHGDFEGSAERSARMAKELEWLKADYEGAIARGVILNESAEMLIKTAGVMSEDLDVWQALYGRKRLALPA